MDLKDFKEFVQNKRRNEFLRVKQTKKYATDPQGYDRMYADVNDEVMSGLQEGAVQRTQVTANYSRKMMNESEERTDVAKANATTRTDAISAESLARRLLLLHRKKLTKESASSQYDCDGAVYEPYKTAREKKTGKFTDVKRRVR